jgi:hypothetical protein
MNGDMREPDPADDDIPVLTDIVVPGRLKPAPPEATDSTPDFVFDIDFKPDERDASAATAAPPAEPVDDFPLAAPGADLDLPLPWTEPESAPEPTPEPAPAARPREADPLIVAAVAKAAAQAVEPPDADAQALLRELLAEIGQGLERRLAQEMAQTEQRLRAALQEELDTRLRELLAGAPPTD